MDRKNFIMAVMLAAPAIPSTALAIRAAAPRAGQAVHAQGAAAPRVRRVRPTAEPKEYVQRIDSQHPLGVVVLLDQSGSMRNVAPGSEQTMSEVAAKTVNDSLMSLLAFAEHGEGDNGPIFKPYFKVAGFGFGHAVRPLFGDGTRMLTMDELFRAGREVNNNGQVSWEWVQGDHGGQHTDLGGALAKAHPLVAQFVQDHPNAPAPVLITVTDGRPEQSTRDERQEAERLKNLRTSDGALVHLVYHIDPTSVRSLVFPSSTNSVDAGSKAFADLMFELASNLPPNMAKLARKQFPAQPIDKNAKALVLNGSGILLPTFLEIGTRSAIEPQNE